MRAALDEMVVSAFHQNAQVKKGFSLESTSPQKKKKRRRVNCLSITSPNSAKVRALWIRLLSSYKLALWIRLLSFYKLGLWIRLLSFYKLMCQLLRTNNIIKSIYIHFICDPNHIDY